MKKIDILLVILLCISIWLLFVSNVKADYLDNYEISSFNMENHSVRIYQNQSCSRQDLVENVRWWYDNYQVWDYAYKWDIFRTYSLDLKEFIHALRLLIKYCN